LPWSFPLLYASLACMWLFLIVKLTCWFLHVCISSACMCASWCLYEVDLIIPPCVPIHSMYVIVLNAFICWLQADSSFFLLSQLVRQCLDFCYYTNSSFFIGSVYSQKVCDCSIILCEIQLLISQCHLPDCKCYCPFIS
jgi:hypothetical protein